MLEEYRDSQSVAYDIMMNEIKNNHISHAYLIDENNNTDAFNIVLAFVSEILCNDLDSLEEKKKISKKIIDLNYPELKIIEPDGMFIKKKQVLDLQYDFSRSSIYGNRRIYIIRDASKMKSETANSMLKFLEEPNSNITAILMTNNYNSMLPTIISRCQFIKLNGSNDNSCEDEYLELAVNFIKSVEFGGIRAILDVQNLVFNNISSKDRDKLVLFFDNLISIYYAIMKIGIESKSIKYDKYFDILSEIALKNSMNTILDKINYLLVAKDSIKYNVNNNLLIDDVIIKLGGSYESSWS